MCCGWAGCARSPFIRSNESPRYGSGSRSKRHLARRTKRAAALAARCLFLRTAGRTGRSLHGRRALDSGLGPQAPEATAIIIWRHAIGLHECAAHALVVAKTTPMRDNLNGVSHRFEKASGGFDAKLLNGPRGPFTGLAKIHSSEVARAHSCRLRQRRYG